VLFCNLFKPCSVCRTLGNFEKPTVVLKVVTEGYFKVCSYLSLYFQFCSIFLNAVSVSSKVFKVGIAQCHNENHHFNLVLLHHFYFSFLPLKVAILMFLLRHLYIGMHHCIGK